VTVSGSVKGNSNAGVNVEISSQNGFYMEPAYYPTDNAGKFSIPFSAPGNGIYLLIFSDSKGYITTKEVSVVMDEMILEPTLTFTPEPTPPPTPDPTPVATTLVTPYPTSTPDTIHTESADVMVYVTIIMALLIFVIGGYLIILWIWNKIRKGGRGGSEWDILG
jgi:hypothetical protein